MAPTAALSVVALVGLAGWRWRLLASSPFVGLPLAARPPEPNGVGPLLRVVEWCGALVHRRVPLAAVASTRSTGIVVIAATGLAVLDPFAATLLVGVVAGLGWWRTRTADRRRRRAIEADLPTATELLVVALLSGCTTEQALDSVVAVHSGVVVDGWRALLRQVQLGSTLDEELRAWGVESGEACERLAEQIIVARTSGASVAHGLRRLAGDHRELARRNAEERARRLPVLMLLPLAVCILPAFILVAVVPVTVSGAGSVVFP